MQKSDFGHCFTLYKKTNPKQIIAINVTAENIKLIEENRNKSL